MQIHLIDMFHASVSQLGTKYTFKDKFPKDCFQFQVDLLPHFYLTRLFNFFIVVVPLFAFTC